MMTPLNPKNVISRSKSDDGYVEYHVLGVGTWEHFDSLVSFFKKYYTAEVFSKEDVVFTRRWVLKCGDEEFVLCHHEDIGNYFYSVSPDGDSALMNDFANDLTERLKNVGYDE